MSLNTSSIVRSALVYLVWFSGTGSVHAGSAGNAELPTQVFAPEVMAPVTKIEAFPAEIQLTTARDRQSIVVQATFADGITRDVTKEATITAGDTRMLKRVGATFYPAADGSTTLALAYGGKSLVVPVKVSQATVQSPLSFRLDVMPVFMRSGCNTGSCHGAARGKDGFRISLFGFDPEGDYFRLTREMVGRRINLAVPSDSTMITKATGAVNHTRRQAVRVRAARPLSDLATVGSKRGRPMTIPASCPSVVGVDLSLSIPSGGSWTARARPSSSPFGHDIPMARTATSPAWPCS